MSIGHGFRRHRRTRTCGATFTSFEADLLRSLAGQLVELLRSEESTEPADPLEQLLDLSGPTSEPEDPVLARLLPTAYTEDEEAAADFRRFTEGTLRNGKVTDAATIVSTLEEAGLGDDPGDESGDESGDDPGPEIEVELDEAAAMSWMRSLTDIRLALAVRLGVQDDDEEVWAAMPEQDPRAQVHGIYQWVGFLQETLVEALS